MSQNLAGIHHVTAICDDPQRNVDFYCSVLGQRLVKQTVNFDMPDTYHLYYGDEIGHPGTIVTFFSWPHTQRGHKGVGQVAGLAFSIPPTSLPYWRDRLQNQSVDFTEEQRFGDYVIVLADSDGLPVELIADADRTSMPLTSYGGVPVEHSIRGLHGVTLLEAQQEPTARLLTKVLGFQSIATEGQRTRYQPVAPDRAAKVDLLHQPGLAYGMVGVGSIHHVAWRTPSDEDQLAWRHRLFQHNVPVTPVRDRQYFHSIYFSEPGGILFEIATDPPGFTLDEPVEALGTRLKLPPWLETQRAVLTESLPVLRVPDTD